MASRKSSSLSPRKARNGARVASAPRKQRSAPSRKPPRNVEVAAVEPDEFSAMGGMPIVSVPGFDRSGDKPAIRDLSWAEFDTKVQQLAQAVRNTFKPNAVVGLVHGGVFVGGAIASALKLDFFPVRVSRRSRDHGSQATDDMPIELKGKRVLIVDDIAASGDSLEFAIKLARGAGVKQLASLALVTRPGRYEPTFSGYVNDEFFVFPWDYAPLTRDSRFGVRPSATSRTNTKAKRAKGAHRAPASTKKTK